MEPCGNSRGLVKAYGPLWNPLQPHETLWTATTPSGRLQADYPKIIVKTIRATSCNNLHHMLITPSLSQNDINIVTGDCPQRCNKYFYEIPHMQSFNHTFFLDFNSSSGEGAMLLTWLFNNFGKNKTNKSCGRGARKNGTLIQLANFETIFDDVIFKLFLHMGVAQL